MTLRAVACVVSADQATLLNNNATCLFFSAPSLCMNSKFSFFHTVQRLYIVHPTSLVLCERTVFKCLLMLISIDDMKSIVGRLLAAAASSC